MPIGVVFVRRAVLKLARIENGPPAVQILPALARCGELTQGRLDSVVSSSHLRHREGTRLVAASNGREEISLDPYKLGIAMSLVFLIAGLLLLLR